MSTITEQIAALEEENVRLKEYQKLVDKAIKMELGKSANEIRKMMSNVEDKQNTPSESFATSICQFFGLQSDEDVNLWTEIMLSDSALNVYRKGRQRRMDSLAPEQGQVTQSVTE